MDPIMLALALAAVAGVGSSISSDDDKTPEHLKSIEDEVKKRVKDASLISVPSEDTFQQVKLPNGEVWLVAPRYLAPMGIGEAKRVADRLGYQLPTVALVNEIYKQADLKLDPLPRGERSKPPSDFTKKTMDSPETHIDQLARIQKQIQQAGNPDFKLLAGTHKDVVFDKIPFGEHAGEMHLGIYGWHQRNGKPIQDFMWGHASGNTPETDWKDYSQGLRLVKRVA